jgi:hypothetical protein
MKTIKETCLQFFQNEDIRKEIKEIIKPIASVVYNEISLYIWLLCLYSIFLIFITLANLFLLVKIYINKKHIIFDLASISSTMPISSMPIP